MNIFLKFEDWLTDKANLFGLLMLVTAMLHISEASSTSVSAITLLNSIGINGLFVNIICFIIFGSVAMVQFVMAQRIPRILVDLFKVFL